MQLPVPVPVTDEKLFTHVLQGFFLFFSFFSAASEMLSRNSAVKLSKQMTLTVFQRKLSATNNLLGLEGQKLEGKIEESEG